LEDTRDIALVQLNLYYHKGFGSTSDSSRFNLIFWEFLIYQVC
jgi:hypothetical protein